MTAALIHSRSHARRLSDRWTVNGFSGFVSFLFEALERQRTRRDLASLDDRMLRDIGLSRYDVEMELKRSWWRS